MLNKNCSGIAMDSSSMLKSRHQRRVCGHCNELLSYSAYHLHKALYYVESEQRWQKGCSTNDALPSAGGADISEDIMDCSTESTACSDYIIESLLDNICVLVGYTVPVGFSITSIGEGDNLDFSESSGCDQGSYPCSANIVPQYADIESDQDVIIEDSSNGEEHLDTSSTNSSSSVKK